MPEKVPRHPASLETSLNSDLARGADASSGLGYGEQRGGECCWAPFPKRSSDIRPAFQGSGHGLPPPPGSHSCLPSKWSEGPHTQAPPPPKCLTGMLAHGPLCSLQPPSTRPSPEQVPIPQDKQGEFRAETSWTRSYCVTWGRSLTLSGPWFPHLE